MHWLKKDGFFPPLPIGDLTTPLRRRRTTWTGSGQDEVGTPSCDLAHNNKVPKSWKPFAIRYVGVVQFILITNFLVSCSPTSTNEISKTKLCVAVSNL